MQLMIPLFLDFGCFLSLPVQLVSELSELFLLLGTLSYLTIVEVAQGSLDATELAVSVFYLIFESSDNLLQVFDNGVFLHKGNIVLFTNLGLLKLEVFEQSLFGLFVLFAEIL